MVDAGADIEIAVTRLAREDGGRVLAILARRFDDLDLADDAVQEGLIAAATTWPRDGVPDNPAGWLLSVSRRRAIDRLRREASARRRAEGAAADLVEQRVSSDAGGWALIDDGDDPDDAMVDERLRLMLLCCHPALDPDAQVPLVLRLVAGLTTAEIAAALLIPEATLAQRIVRAKRKIKTAGIPLSLPGQLGERLDVVLAVLYLVLNEGYLSRSEAGQTIRVDLVDESIRLTRILHELVPLSAEVVGLLALELFGRARSDARVDAAGDLVLLEDQDRSTWDLTLIEEANRLLAAALEQMSPGPFQLQAIIASHHANARTADVTNWPMIVTLYGQLAAMIPSPVVELNRAVAIAMADGPHAGLAALDRVEGLDDYHLFHATLGELRRRSGDLTGAGEAFDRALDLVTSPAERRHLERQRGLCAGQDRA